MQVHMVIETVQAQSRGVSQVHIWLQGTVSGHADIDFLDCVKVDVSSRSQGGDDHMGVGEGAGCLLYHSPD